MILPYRRSGFMAIEFENIRVKFLCKYQGVSEYEFATDTECIRLSEEQIRNLEKHHQFRKAYGAYRCSVRDGIQQYYTAHHLSPQTFWQDYKYYHPSG